uniref:Uncharacterized protein n=1 Tax=Sphaerodactylus townsendi TaxID=933632 RepID=A0ACB8FAA7_9SAUR
MQLAEVWTSVFFAVIHASSILPAFFSELLWKSYYLDGRVAKVTDFLKTRLLDTLSDQIRKIQKVRSCFQVMKPSLANGQTFQALCQLFCTEAEGANPINAFFGMSEDERRPSHGGSRISLWPYDMPVFCDVAWEKMVVESGGILPNADKTLIHKRLSVHMCLGKRSGWKASGPPQKEVPPTSQIPMLPASFGVEKCSDILDDTTETQFRP